MKRQVVVLSTIGILLSAAATPVLAEESSDGSQRVIEETLVYKDPTVSSQGKWLFGVAAEELYTHGPYKSYSSSGDGELESGTVTATKPGLNLFAGYGDVTVNFTYRSGSENVTLNHTATSVTPFNYSHTVTFDEKENELDVRWRISQLSIPHISPYVYVGLIDIKSNNSDTLSPSSGLKWVYNGSPTSLSTTEWKGGMAGLGAILPLSPKYGFRIDGGLTGTNATWTRSDGATVSGSGIGGRFTATAYYNIVQGLNAQLGGRYVYLNGGNAGSKSILGVFAMLGYSFK